MREAHQATEARNGTALQHAAGDDLCARTAAVQRRASLALGRNLLRAARAIALPAEREAVSWIGEALGEMTPRASGFGAVAAAFGVEAEDAADAHRYTVLSGMVAAAVRLRVASPLEGQAALRRALDAGERSTDGEWGFFSPLLEIAAMGHELLEPRLFAS